MKAKLVKKGEHYYSLLLVDNRELLATTEDTKHVLKLSKENCDYIFRVFDIRKLAEIDFECDMGSGPTSSGDINSMIRKGYINGAEFGFNKVMGLIDKLNQTK
jgi:hypothetical protein